ncbi:MAG TPA: hypothetical protein VFI95_15260 [Terriglobales bacterium]|nr:hypothetical protein [Terriglobales bacterium]
MQSAPMMTPEALSFGRTQFGHQIRVADSAKENQIAKVAYVCRQLDPYQGAQCKLVKLRNGEIFIQYPKETQHA